MFQKIESVIKDKTNSFFIQLFRYIFVGGVSFLIDIETLYILTEYLHLNYLISAGIAFFIGLNCNYFFSIKWVFDCRVIESKSIEFLLFSFVGLVGLGLNELFLWLFTDVYGIYYLYSKTISAFLVCFWNFSGRKILLFNKQNLLFWVKPL